MAATVTKDPRCINKLVLKTGDNELQSIYCYFDEFLIVPLNNQGLQDYTK